MDYFAKMKGTTKSPPPVSTQEIILSWLGGFIGIAVVSHIHYAMLAGTDLILMVGSFGATAVLVFGATKSPLAQPRNVIGGHVLAALVGVAAYQLLGGLPWLACAAAVATAIAVMHMTKTLHPPAGATALIAVVGDAKIHDLGFMYALIPVGVGVTILVIVGLIFNNIPKTRRYPEFWL